MDKKVAFTIFEQKGTRIDKVIAEHERDLTRSYIQKIIKEGNVSVNGKVVKANYKVEEKDEVTILIPAPVELDI